MKADASGESPSNEVAKQASDGDRDGNRTEDSKKMSAEVEANNKEEEPQPKTPPKPIRKRVAENWQLIAKILELILCIVCTVLIVEPCERAGMGTKYIHHVYVIFTAFTGQLVIIGVLLISHSLGDRIPYRTSAIFSIVGSALFLISATLIFADRAYLTKNYIFHPNKYLMDMLVWSGISAIANALLLSADAAITYRRQKDF